VDRTKKVENVSTFYYPPSNVAGSIGTKNSYWWRMRRFCFVPIRSDPLLIFRLLILRLGGGGGGVSLFCRFWTVFSWKLYSRYCTVGSLYTFVRFSKVFSDFSFARRGVFWIFDAYKRDICFQNFQTISKLDGWRKCRWTFINTHTNDSRLIRVFQQTFMFIFPWNVVFIPWMVNYNWKQI
jgi:hypothetical protein